MEVFCFWNIHLHLLLPGPKGLGSLGSLRGRRFKPQFPRNANFSQLSQSIQSICFSILFMPTRFVYFFRLYSKIMDLFSLEIKFSKWYTMFDNIFSSHLSFLVVLVCFIVCFLLICLSDLFRKISAMPMVRTWETWLEMTITHAPHISWKWYRLCAFSKFWMHE